MVAVGAVIEYKDTGKILLAQRSSEAEFWGESGNVLLEE